MNLKPKHNIPVSSVSTGNGSELLAAYQEWSGNASATASELYSFITTPGASRNEFLSTVSVTGTVSTNYIFQDIE